MTTALNLDLKKLEARAFPSVALELKPPKYDPTAPLP
jgi:hypothetical protein